jgi:glycerophosphoryl diester phosphodiesterase
MDVIAEGGVAMIKRALVIFVVIMVSIMVADNYSGKRFTVKSKNVKIIGHRGSSKRAPENTVSSILCAAEDKADYAELDVQETKDGVVVLMHDKNLKRVAKVDKNLSEVAYKDIEKLDVGSIYSGKFKGEKIPTLDQVIKAAKGKIKLDIEIKNYKNDTDLARKVVQLIENNDFVDNCLVCSFDYRTLIKVKKLNPKIRTGYITALNEKDKLNLEYVDYYSIYYPKVTKSIVEKLHKNNKKVHVWTVDNVDDWRRLIQMGVDDIITNYPGALKSI